MRGRDADGEEGEALSTTGLHIPKPKPQPHGKIHIFLVYSRAAAAICQIQAHTRPRHFHKAGMTQSQVLLLPILVPNWAPRVPLGFTKKHQPSLTPNTAKMGHTLLTESTSEVCLQAKLHQLPPPLLHPYSWYQITGISFQTETQWERSQNSRIARTKEKKAGVSDRDTAALLDAQVWKSGQAEFHCMLHSPCFKN